MTQNQTSRILRFKGQDIPGAVTKFHRGKPSLQTWRTHFAGIEGVSQITGGLGETPIEVELFLYGNFSTRDSIIKYIEETLNYDLIAETDTLTYQPDVEGEPPRDYNNCYLEGVENSPPLPDEAETLDGGWFCHVSLHFTQLAPRD